MKFPDSKTGREVKKGVLRRVSLEQKGRSVSSCLRTYVVNEKAEGRSGVSRDVFMFIRTEEVQMRILNSRNPSSRDVAGDVELVTPSAWCRDPSTGTVLRVR